MSGWKLNLSIGAVGLLVGLLCGWWWGRPVEAPPEFPAPSVRQADGSLVVERVSPATVPQKPPHALPVGSREERRVSIVVQPPRGVVVSATTVESSDVADHRSQPGKMVDSCDCPPVQVDLSLVRMPDKTRRVVASSPTGTILSGIDVPVEAEAAPRIPRWTLSAIAVADKDGVRPGALLARRVGPLVVGGGAFTDPTLKRPALFAQLGLAW